MKKNDCAERSDAKKGTVRTALRTRQGVSHHFSPLRAQEIFSMTLAEKKNGKKAPPSPFDGRKKKSQKVPLFRSVAGASCLRGLQRHFDHCYECPKLA